MRLDCLSPRLLIYFDLSLDLFTTRTLLPLISYLRSERTTQPQNTHPQKRTRKTRPRRMRKF
jgi:hypothetical protein